MRKTILLLFALIGALNATAAVSVEARIDSLEILIGEQTGVTVTVTSDKEAQVVFPVARPLDIIIPGVEVISMSAVDTREIERGMQYSCVYTITSFDENLYYLPPFAVLVNGDTMKTKSLALKVLTVEVDTLNVDNFFGPKDVQDNPFLWTEWAPMFYLSLIMIIVLAAAYYLYIRLRDNKPIIRPLKLVKKLLPHQKAMKSIEQIKADKMMNAEDQKEYYTRLTETLRRYIEERYGFYAMEMTSTEIIERLSEVQDKSALEELSELFRTADLVKFAKFSALINENDRNLVNAIEFINTTKVGYVAPQEEAPKLSEEESRTLGKRRTLKIVVIALTVAAAALLIYIVIKTALLI